MNPLLIQSEKLFHFKFGAIDRLYQFIWLVDLTSKHYIEYQKQKILQESGYYEISTETENVFGPQR